MASLDSEEIRRYSRQLVLPEMGEEGQLRLKQGSVLLVGAGGLGSPMALYLAAAGVGRIGLVEFDRVDSSNLHRQVLYGSDDVGRPKLKAARERIRDINPHVTIETHPVRLESGNALDILREYDVIADGSDNFATRYLVNDACVLLGRPDVYGSVFRFEGQVTVFDARSGPCYRCLFPEPPPPGSVPSCAEGGVLGILPGVVGLLQATEVVKLLIGRGETLGGRLLLYDALAMEFRELRIDKDPACPICGERPSIRELTDYEAFCGPGAERPGGTDRSAAAVEGGEGGGAIGGGSGGAIGGDDGGATGQDKRGAAGRDEEGARAGAGMPFPRDRIEVGVSEVHQSLARGGDLLLLDVREPFERKLASLPGALAIPMGEIPSRIGEIDRERPVVVFCHTGARSLEVAAFLRSRGLAGAWSLRGGIEAWALGVDPSVGRY